MLPTPAKMAPKLTALECFVYGMGSFMFRDEHSAACCEQAVALCLPQFYQTLVFLSGKQAWEATIYLFCNLWQGDRGEAGPPGRGERGDPGAPGPKVSYSYIGGELSLAWECTPLAVEYATSSSPDAKTTQITSTSLKCTLMASDFAVQLFLFTLCSSVKKFNSISERKGRVAVIYNTPSLNVC